MLSLLSISAGATTAITVAVVAVVFLFILMLFLPIGTYFIAAVSNAHISMGRLVGMKMRRIKYKQLVDVYIRAKKAGLDIDIAELESHVMAGGNISNVVNALISAHSANIDLSLQSAKAIDLAGRDVLNAVRVSVNPKVIETPVISAIAKNGIELRVKARVTVRANIARLIGGAGEETIIARVGEGIVTTVGSSETHKEVLENPDMISKTVLAKGLDSGTAYEILSIDIATWTWVATSAHNCRWTRQKQTSVSRKPTPKNAAQWQSLRNRKTAPARRKCAPRLWKPKRKCPAPWQKHSARADWASWTTTRCKTFRLTRQCATR